MLSETVIEWTKKWKEEGFAAGKAEGEAGGETKGREEERRLLAMRLLARDMSVAEVAELTGLAVGDVEALRHRGVSSGASTGIEPSS